jgi:hypothetical protein
MFAKAGSLILSLALVAGAARAQGAGKMVS